MPRLIGSFVFRNEGDGCLTAKYLNDSIHTPFTECCKQKGVADPDKPFVGSFTSTWIEAIDQHEIATLEITQTGNVFKLEWSVLGKERNPTFTGKAMLYHDLLVGHYISHP